MKSKLDLDKYYVTLLIVSVYYVNFVFVGKQQDNHFPYSFFYIKKLFSL